VDGLVLPGGESTTIGKLLVRFDLLEPLQQRIRAGLPVFGTCAGMILLSDELDQDRLQPLVGGLAVRTRRNAFGRQVDSFDTASRWRHRRRADGRLVHPRAEGRRGAGRRGRGARHRGR
jgi:pyridoxal 5'-phosphate synthase glutaminase subunit Pdx2